MIDDDGDLFAIRCNIQQI